ncbi:unnamed protein product [Rhizoctonia solani]|uniref:Fungal-type protein kinase domain-containing protein n=3 Tax=Rhizoctonia solani TaxID=456999 RepID=A0A8H3CJ70_9AGAM|nr:APH domain protein [Rhizoctonia solani AG-3 Rhs1AP]KEP47777.1 APH domain protein [Rhizoctonia solani 123E]CAE6481163.1 unnamed protein product [Rhizoctonia solani]CAE6495281.1 unnamed protein product [Rhizoctonia solani]
MAFCVEDELRGAIFCDPNFVANFLSIDKAKQALLEKELNKRPKNTQAKLDGSITVEHRLYGPILGVLRSIKEAADIVRVAHHLGVLGTNFDDYHATIISSDDPDTQIIKPDLVLFEDDDCDRRSWETLMMPIEVKVKSTYLKVGMKQLAQYARTVFTHQIHRRHMYGMVICKWSATFVRFDRSGIIHSEPMDMLDNPKEFRKAFAGLMMLDRHSFGYDTAFTREYTPEGQLEYYVELPATAFLSSATQRGSNPVVGSMCSSEQQSSTLQPLPTRRFKVMDRLCHRKSILGHATIVLHIREVKERVTTENHENLPTGRMTRSRTRLRQLQMSESKWDLVSGGHEYALKLIWREPDAQQEGAMLKRLEGKYAVVQCQWYSDILQWDADCHKPGATSCDICCDMTPAQAPVQQVENLGDLDVKVALEAEGKEPRYVEVETDNYVGRLDTHRTARIYSWTLLSTVGGSLSSVKSPRQFLEAVLDALLGYWQAFNQGILHRDISVGNVLIIDPGRERDARVQKRKHIPDPLVLNGQQTNGAQNSSLEKSRRLVQETIMELERGPIGLLSDFDLATTHNRMESEIFTHASVKRHRSCSQASDTEGYADAGPPSKRLRRNAHASSSSSTSSPSNVQEEWHSEGSSLSYVTVSTQEVYQPIDYRTGTPTFMSIRVLEVELGTPYEHHFMDDLESFFWLILWSVIEHVDPSSDENGGNHQRTQIASSILYRLNPVDLDSATIAAAKCSLLRTCADGGEYMCCTMTKKLEACGNSWATNPVIIDMVIKLGAHFEHITAKLTRFSRCTPEAEFPKIVGIISEGLKGL